MPLMILAWSSGMIIILDTTCPHYRYLLSSSVSPSFFYSFLSPLSLSLSLSLSPPSLPLSLSLISQGDVWICMELMDRSLDIVCRSVYNKLKERIPESIVGSMAFAVSEHCAQSKLVFPKSYFVVTTICFHGIALSYRH